MSVRTILVATCAFLAGAAALLAVTSLVGSSDRPPVPPVEVAPAQRERQRAPRDTQQERRERRPSGRRGGFAPAPRPSTA